MRFLLLGAALFTVPVHAQTLKGDARFQTIEYNANRVPTVRTAPGTEQILLLAPTEFIQSVFLSDPNAYVVEVSETGDGLTLRPNGRAQGARLSIKTALRSYELELTSSSSSVPQVIQFAYTPLPAASGSATPPKAAPGVAYKLSGSKVLRPASITDDGKKMYINWSEDQAIPAIFAVGPSGGEEMVNGFMRAGVFTIDRVYDRLVFRVDRLSATAKRTIAKAAVK